MAEDVITSGYTWEKYIINKSVVFKLIRKKTVDNSAENSYTNEDEGITRGLRDNNVYQIVEPSDSCWEDRSNYADKYDVFCSYSRWLLFDNGETTLEKLLEGKPVRSYLSAALSYLKPNMPAHPFYAFGIDLCCVDHYQAIYDHEGVGKYRYEKQPLTETAAEMMSFLKNLSSGSEDHLLARLVYGRLTERNKAIIEECVVGFTKKNTFFSRIWALLMKEAQGDMSRIPWYTETELEEIVRLILNLDGACTSGVALSLPLFNHLKASVERRGLCTTTDLRYYSDPSDPVVTCNVGGGTSSMLPVENLDEHSGVVNVEFVNLIGHETFSAIADSTDNDFEPHVIEGFNISRMVSRSSERIDISVRVKCLWQVFEKLLASMLHTDFDTAAKQMLFQAAMLIENNRVQPVVLAVSIDVYKEIQCKTNSSDTMTYIRSMCSQGKMWCRLYVPYIEDNSIMECLQMAKDLFEHFCIAL